MANSSPLETAVKNDNAEGVLHHLPNASLKSISRAVSHAIEFGTFNALRALLINMPTKTHQNMSQWLQDAVCTNKTEALEVLATHVHPRYKDMALHSTLHHACISGNIDAVRCLIQYTLPTYNSSEALLSAAHHGHTDIVKLLIPVSDPLAQTSNALRLAAREGHQECFKLLLPHSNMQDFERYQTITLVVEHDHSDFLKNVAPLLSAKSITDGMTTAFRKNRPLCIDILFDYCVPSDIQAHLSEREHKQWNACVDRCIEDRAQKLKQRITDQMAAQSTSSKSTRKM